MRSKHGWTDLTTSYYISADKNTAKAEIHIDDCQFSVNHENVRYLAMQWSRCCHFREERCSEMLGSSIKDSFPWKKCKLKITLMLDRGSGEHLSKRLKVSIYPVSVFKLR